MFVHCAGLLPFLAVLSDSPAQTWRRSGSGVGTRGWHQVQRRTRKPGGTVQRGYPRIPGLSAASLSAQTRIGGITSRLRYRFVRSNSILVLPTGPDSVTDCEVYRDAHHRRATFMVHAVTMKKIAARLSSRSVSMPAAAKVYGARSIARDHADGLGPPASRREPAHTDRA